MELQLLARAPGEGAVGACRDVRNKHPDRSYSNKVSSIF